ncbi:hypothetical protein J8281_04850 [Aquimarina sp. U1-2]|uniref:hypothetical protein n=1 Tax=Aquimarina sp. U1-2 TaxID=2823141 RepID=UPI001AECB2D0|nr:hypothetical protein [Aquimarina sp. U1-2]MBP2831509.1 hypothetical protein [Aquimarina sp. U1-2]
MKQIQIALFCVTVIFYGCASYGPKNKELSSVLLTTQQRLEALQKKLIETNDSKLLNVYNELNEKSLELFPVLEKCNDKYALTPEYISTLKETEKTLSYLLKNYETIANKEYLIHAIYQDYDAKLSTIRNTAQNNATTKIKVIVNSNEEEGFFVFGKLSYEREQDIKRFRFNRPTQDAIHDFVPGYYLFWLEKDDRIGEPELHLIMSTSGEEEKTLVLQTPK